MKPCLLCKGVSMCDVTLISPSFFTNKSDVLAMIQESTADLLVLPTWADTTDTHQALFEYPNPTEIQAVLSKGQRLYCQQLRTNKAPRNLILSRKEIGSNCQKIVSTSQKISLHSKKSTNNIK